MPKARSLFNRLLLLFDSSFPDKSKEKKDENKQTNKTKINEKPLYLCPGIICYSQGQKLYLIFIFGKPKFQSVSSVYKFSIKV